MAMGTTATIDPSGYTRHVPRLGKFRPGPVGLAITLFDVWRRLPPKQRKLVLDMARKHGPKAASKLMQIQRARRGRP
ncbi:MAG: hypothetical protein QOF43_1813 [Gaiellaceae bacterium]|nr:hypothetical protein [Gaiellaceae bacterium]